MNKDFLEQWIYQDEHAEVALLSAPVTFPPVPSIALSIFRSALKDSGITSKVIYCSFPTIHQLGTDTIYGLSEYIDFQKNAEYLFAGLTDVSASAAPREFIDAFTSSEMPEEKKQELTVMVSQALGTAEVIVEAAARRILHMGARIVAASSIYTQQNASLAILKRVKELDPSIRTIIGGHNVSGVMGMTVLKYFPSVDYVSFGEGDETIAQVCKSLLANDGQPLPYGIVGHEDELPEMIPYRMTKDMNKVAFPDYRDFFEEIRMEADGFYGEIPVYYAQTYEKTVFLEGSRGCWWNEKHPCAFCGLNGLTNVYREKTPQKLYDEIREITARYPGVNIQLSDNVLSRNMIRELLPMLAKDPEQYRILAEVKTDLRSEDVKALAQAGVLVTQPGIESLNDHLLRLMGKGSSAVQNVALMKYCRSCRIYPVWNMMTQVPGENREDYEQMLELIPLIVHLNPPTRANTIAFMRFSRYGDHPEDYGLELQPDPLYSCCFKDMPDIISNIGIYYEQTGGPFMDTIRENMDLYRKIHKAVYTWRQQFYSHNPPVLAMKEGFFGLIIHDTRPCAEEHTQMILGLAARIYRLAWKPVSLRTLVKNLPDITEEKIRQTLDDLIRRKLMVCLSDRYLALAVDHSM